MYILRASFVAAAFLGIAACTPAVDLENQPLTRGQANPVQTTLNWSPDRPLIVMSFSGGGSRAAAAALDTLQVLQEYGDGTPGRHLIDDVALISSVSGGSVTAAYFTLYGGKALADLEPNFLARDNMTELELQAVDPITVSRLLWGGYARVDALRDLLNRQLFHGKTFADAVGPGHPVMILNATDMASGDTFAFTPERFNEICSNLSALPLATGVAASAAFPIVLSPVNLQDFAAAGCAGSPPSEPWIDADLNSNVTRYLNLDEYEAAEYANALRHGSGTSRDIRYLHLLDGGLADNLGVHSLTDAILSPHSFFPILQAINEGKIRRLIVITVRARSTSPSPLDEQAWTPGIVQMLNSVTSDPIDAATSNIDTEKDALLDDLRSAASSAAETSAAFHDFGLYNIDVDFGQLGTSQSRLEHAVEKIPTSWTLSRLDLANSHLAVKLLDIQQPCFQQLLIDLHEGLVADLPLNNSACPQQAISAESPDAPT